MKIAQIVCVYPPYKGGIGTSALETARILSLKGFEVTTFTIDYGSVSGGASSAPAANREENNDGSENRPDRTVRLKAFPKFGKGGFLPQLLWRLGNFDVIYFNYPFFGAAEIVWFLKKFVWKKKKKLIIRYHMETVLPGLFLKVLSFPSALIFSSLLKEADLIMSASLDYVENSQLKDVYKKYQKKFVEIPYGVDTEIFKPAKPAIPAETGAAEDNGKKPFKIIFVGGLDRAHYFKGVNILLEAVAGIAPVKDWSLEIIGGGDLRPQYEDLAQKLGLADKVIFAGKVSDEELPEKYRQADCLVLPSINRGEAFGIVLLEAMASGLPVIASELPGVRKVFTGGQEGFLVKLGNAADLKDKIQFFLENPEARRTMGQAARRLAEEKYSREKIGDKLEEEIIKLENNENNTDK